MSSGFNSTTTNPDRFFSYFFKMQVKGNGRRRRKLGAGSKRMSHRLAAGGT